MLIQGEEAPIIVAMLVRSNDDGRIGFLKEAQRVNILYGGAMEASRCFECCASIGGGDHRLNSINRVAGGLVR